MYKIKNASRERDGATFMPYVGHVAPGVMLLENGALLAVMSLVGAPWETLDASSINAALDQRNALLMNIAAPGLSLSTHLIRRLDDGSSFPTDPCQSPFARELDETYRAKLTSNRLWRNQIFLSVMIRPAMGAMNDNFITSLFKRKNGAPVPRRADPASIRLLDDIVSTIGTAFAKYRPRRLTVREQRGVSFSEIGEFLRLVITGQEMPVPLVAGHLGAALYSERVIIGRETIEIRGEAGSTYAAMFGLREYPAKTYPGIFDSLLWAPYRCCLTQTFNFLDKSEALGRMDRKSNQMTTAGDKAASQREELVDAQDAVQRNMIVMGDHHLSLATYANDIVRLRSVTARAKSDLADSGAIIAREDLGLAAAYWAQLPGNNKYRTRPGAISTRNFAGMASFHNYPPGVLKGHWGQAMTMFRTSGGTPYPFHFHPPNSNTPDLGNVFVSGPAGSGKTTLILFLLAMAERAKAKKILFDKDNGGEILVRAAGGSYLSLQSGAPSGLAPLKALTNSPEDLVFLRNMIIGLIGVTLDPEQERRLMMGKIGRAHV